MIFYVTTTGDIVQASQLRSVLDAVDMIELVDEQCDHARFIVRDDEPTRCAKCGITLKTWREARG